MGNRPVLGEPTSLGEACRKEQLHSKLKGSPSLRNKNVMISRKPLSSTLASRSLVTPSTGALYLICSVLWSLLGQEVELIKKTRGDQPVCWCGGCGGSGSRPGDTGPSRTGHHTRHAQAQQTPATSTGRPSSRRLTGPRSEVEVERNRGRVFRLRTQLHEQGVSPLGRLLREAKHTCVPSAATWGRPPEAPPGSSSEATPLTPRPAAETRCFSWAFGTGGPSVSSFFEFGPTST